MTISAKIGDIKGEGRITKGNYLKHHTNYKGVSCLLQQTNKPLFRPLQIILLS